MIESVTGFIGRSTVFGAVAGIDATFVFGCDGVRERVAFSDTGVAAFGVVEESACCGAVCDGAVDAAVPAADESAAALAVVSLAVAAESGFAVAAFVTTTAGTTFGALTITIPVAIPRLKPKEATNGIRSFFIDRCRYARSETVLHRPLYDDQSVPRLRGRSLRAVHEVGRARADP